MDGGILGALVGTVVGVVGSVIGTAASLRRAKSPTERRYVIKWAVLLSVLIGAFLTGLWIVPAPYRAWIWGLYVALLPLVVSLPVTAATPGFTTIAVPTPPKQGGAVDPRSNRRFGVALTQRLCFTPSARLWAGN